MTRTEWIQQAMLRSGNNTSSRDDTIAAIVKTADVLEKTAPWDDEPATARESFIRGTEVGHAEAKKICAQILQSNGIVALVHHLGIVGWVASADSVVAAVKAEREACAEIADADAKKYSEMARKWETSGDCSARNFHEAGGAAIVGREIRDAIRMRGDM